MDDGSGYINRWKPLGNFNADLADWRRAVDQFSDFPAVRRLGAPYMVVYAQGFISEQPLRVMGSDLFEATEIWSNQIGVFDTSFKLAVPNLTTASADDLRALFAEQWRDPATSLFERHGVHGLRICERSPSMVAHWEAEQMALITARAPLAMRRNHARL